MILKKSFRGLALMMLILTNLYGQDSTSDSLKELLVNAPSDSVKVDALLELGRYYEKNLLKNDTAFIIYENALSIAREKGFVKQEILSLRQMAGVHTKYLTPDSAHLILAEALSMARQNHFADQEILVLRTYIATESGFFVKDDFFTNYEKMLSLSRENNLDSLQFMGTFAQAATDMGNYPKALQVLFEILHANEEKQDSAAIEYTLYRIGHTYVETNDTKRAIAYLNKAKEYGDKDPFYYIFIHDDLAKAYLLQQQNDSALYYADLTYKLALRLFGSEDKVYGGVLNDLGMTYDALGKDSLALNYLRRSLVYFTKVEIQYLNYCVTTIGLAQYFHKREMPDSTLFYARLSLGTALDKGFLPYISESSSLITAYFQNINNTDSAYFYQQIGFEAYKTLYNDESSRQIQNMSLSEQRRLDDIALAKKNSDDAYAAKLRLYALLTIGIVALMIGLIVYRNNRRRKKSYDLLKKQKQEIDQQKSQLESSIKELQTTQSQLIQSEKMASLGELTAGIAHEIQNPLNFVNNFSEVSSEMLDEMKEVLTIGNHHEALEIADDIKLNLEKITHHGKRADSIVKGMLEHSRTSTGTKEPADINALADEYLRLSYHGLRAKDKSFNADIKTDFDESLEKIDVIPQDIGRVLLNLFNNAFYAVQEKAKEGKLGFSPVVSVTTKRVENHIEIRITDNGNGIPDSIKDKIFQPFYTTKPTGQGTGLGLSLSYDIIKAHGGELKVETKVDEGNPDNIGKGKGTTFIIQIPS